VELADIIVALVGFGTLVVVAACGIAAFAVMREIWADYRGLFHQLRKHPRFGIGAMFSLVTIAAAACALFRWAGDANLPVVTGVVAFTALVFAIGIVFGIQFVVRDLFEDWSRRKSWSSRRDVTWQEPTRCDSNDSSSMTEAPYAAGSRLRPAARSVK
jgi:hypothetical protein